MSDKAGTEIIRDPVCGTVLPGKHSGLVSEYRGRKYYFCCSGCRNSFHRDPALLLKGYSTSRAEGLGPGARV